jgi:polyisoprenoid-binding protein YceI
MSIPDLNEHITGTRWRLDPERSSAEFRVPHFWGLMGVKGRFSRLDGWLETDESGPRRLELTIDATSLDTANAKRDSHLRGGDFFDVERHPTIQFVAGTVAGLDPDHLLVNGELLAAGNGVVLDLQPSITRTDGALEIDVTTALDQRRLGMTWSPLGMTRTPTTVTIHAHLRPE